jgi:hypothetical protein
MTRKTLTVAGAAVGLAAFLALGLLPSLLYGGYAGVMLAGAVLGTPVAATLAVRGLVILGMVLGVLLVGGLFTMAGAAAGAAVAVLTSGAAPRERRHETKA